MKKVISVVLSVLLILGTMTTVTFAANETDPMVINADATLENVNITATEGPAIAIAEGANVTLTIVGDNYVEGAIGFAGIYVPETSTLTIVGDGTLTAVGGDALEYKPNTSEYPNLWNMFSAGAGIGGNGCSYVRNRDFVGGKLNTYYENLTYPSFGIIVIEMDETGKIVATGGNSVTNQGSGAGIGSGGSNPLVHKSDGSDEYDIPFAGAIEINSGVIEATGGAGPNASSANSGAGIGAGCCSQAVAENEIDIIITGGTIVATGANDAAAIGGGSHVEGGDITITGGNITAVSGDGSASGNGAGIGAGHMAYEGVIRIEGDAVVSATANGNAAGIGAGADTNYNNQNGSTDELHCENVIFGGNAQIEFDGGKTTFFTVEGENVTFTSDSAVFGIVNTDGVTIGLASSFAEAVSVINEYKNVDSLSLVKDATISETVVIEDDVTVDGNGYTLSSEDAVSPVAPVKVTNGAEVTFKNIKIHAGDCTRDWDGWAYAAIEVDGATINVIDSELIGGDAFATSADAAGSAIEAENGAIVNVTDSTLSTGDILGGDCTSSVVIIDNTSNLSVHNVKFYYSTTDKVSPYFEAAIGVIDGNAGWAHTNPVEMSGIISVFGRDLDGITIVVPEGESVEFRGDIGAEYISNTLAVKYVKKDVDDQGEDTEENFDMYDIVIEGDKQFINRLTSADLTFKLTSTTDIAPIYEILPVAPVVITENADYANRYMFNFDGITQPDDTAKEILIAQVKVTGYGAYTFEIDADKTTNIANATKTNDSVVEHFVPNGNVNVGEGNLIIDNKINAEILVPTRDLEIVIDFPNSVNKNVAAYQDMTVTVDGGDLKEAVIIRLGNETVEQTIATEYEKQNAKYTIDIATDNKYVVNVIDILAVNNSYTVTVEGAGYRTARYTVTMTDDKELNFWNNVMDEKQVVEVKKDSSKTVKNFLAGDIVKDANINIYDLSAVVSYFGTTNDATAYSDYAKYDLNRDGLIDSKDVAYVLVSWGE